MGVKKVSILKFIKIVLITVSFLGVFIGVSWSIIDKKYNYNTLLMICCIVLIVAFNI